MTLQIPPGFMQVSLLFSLANDPEMMVTTIGSDTNGDPATTLDHILDTWAAKWSAAEMVDAYTFRGGVALVGQDGPGHAVVEDPRTIPGTYVAPAPPSNLAVLIRKQTGLGGRRGRGRMFWPPFIYGEVSVSGNGMWTATIPPAQNVKLATWVGENDFVLLHNDDTAPTPITGLFWDPLAATQRRRMRP